MLLDIGRHIDRQRFRWLVSTHYRGLPIINLRIPQDDEKNGETLYPNHNICVDDGSRWCVTDVLERGHFPAPSLVGHHPPRLWHGELHHYHPDCELL